MFKRFLCVFGFLSSSFVWAALPAKPLRDVLAQRARACQRLCADACRPKVRLINIVYKKVSELPVTKDFVQLLYKKSDADASVGSVLEFSPKGANGFYFLEVLKKKSDFMVKFVHPEASQSCVVLVKFDASRNLSFFVYGPWEGLPLNINELLKLCFEASFSVAQKVVGGTLSGAAAGVGALILSLRRAPLPPQDSLDPAADSVSPAEQMREILKDLSNDNAVKKIAELNKIKLALDDKNICAELFRGYVSFVGKAEATLVDQDYIHLTSSAALVHKQLCKVLRERGLDLCILDRVLGQSGVVRFVAIRANDKSTTASYTAEIQFKLIEHKPQIVLYCLFIAGAYVAAHDAGLVVSD